MFSVLSHSSRFQKIGITALVSLSGIAMVCADSPPATPSGEISGGKFAQYFQNIITTNCTGINLLTGFSVSSDINFGKGNCTSIGPIIGTFFAGQIAPAGQAITGFNQNGTPIFSQASQWTGSVPGNIYYTGGSVGIGTNTIQPGAKLQVGGAIRALGGIPNAADNSTRGFAFDSDGDTGLFSTTSANPNISNGLGLYTNSSLGIYIDSTISPAPFVGIGTNAPQAKLDVRGDALINNLTVGRGSGNISSNTAFGYQTLFVDTSGNNNTAIGFRGLFSNINGANNTALGYGSLTANTSGNDNTANGFGSLYKNISGNYNTAIGYYSLFSNIDGKNNTANGMYALRENISGYQNTAVGVNALISNTSGNSNTANGYNALYQNVDGVNNTANGMQSLVTNTSGNSNTAYGAQSLYNLTTGSNNTAIGHVAGLSLTTGSNNIVIGYNAQVPYSTGSNQLNIGNWIYGTGGKIGIGTNAPTAKFTVQNGAIGGKFAILPSYSTWSQYGVGDGGAAIYNDNGTYQKLMIIGNNSASGSREVGIWDNLMVNGNTTVNRNAIVNGNLGVGTATPDHKLVVAGSSPALVNFISSAGNAYIRLSINNDINQRIELANRGGRTALWNPQTGDAFNILNNGNVGIGTTNPSSKLDVVGQIISRYLNDASGVYSQFRAIWGNYGFMIRNDGSNTYFLLTNPGDQTGQWNALRPFIINDTNGEVAINTKLTVNGNIFAQNYYYTSDRRLKKDIVPIQSPLEKIKALNGYTFAWKDTGIKSVGVIAQEVEKVFPELVGETQTASGMTIKTVQYGNLVAPLIESVKELSRLHDQDQKDIANLKDEVKQMHEDIESLKQQIKK